MAEMRFRVTCGPKQHQSSKSIKEFSPQIPFNLFPISKCQASHWSHSQQQTETAKTAEDEERRLKVALTSSCGLDYKCAHETLIRSQPFRE